MPGPTNKLSFRFIIPPCYFATKARAEWQGLPARTASHSLSVNPEELKLNHQFRRHENAASRPARYFCRIHDEQYGA